jgi:Zinc carboxypeptidase
MSFEYDDPIIHMPRKGTQDSPFRDVEESLIIDNSGKVILNEYPNRFRRVIVTDDKGNNLYEIKSGTPDENGFFVDYSSKTITFNKAHIGKQFHFKYSGEGNSFIPVNSIYTERDGLKVTETLDGLTETTKQARDEAKEQASYAKEQGEKAEDVAINTRYVEPYNDKKLYHKNNIVTHNGNSYMAKKDTIGNEPTGYGDDEYWGLVGFRGQDGVGSVSVKKHTFVATEGQKVFKLPFSYEPLKNRTRVYVGGAPQNTPENYEETNENTITLTEGVKQGTAVYVEVFSTEFDDRIAEFDEKMGEMTNSINELDDTLQEASDHLEYIKSQGDYAKSQGDFAKEKGEKAAIVSDNLEYTEPYNPTKQYKKNNIVSLNGNSFIAKKDNVGNPPPTDLEIEIENEYWGLVGRKGEDGTGTVHTIKDEFVASEGQKIFNLSRTYDQFQNRTKVTIDGVPQYYPENYDETTPKSITLKEGVYEGAKVVVEYFSQSVPLESDIATTVHNHTGELNQHSETLINHSNKLNEHSAQLGKLENIHPSINSIWTPPTLPDTLRGNGTVPSGYDPDEHLDALIEPLVDNDYVTRHDLGVDESGQYMIRRYDFTPKHYEKTILLTAGTHGNEYTAFYALYQFLDLLVKRWYEFPQLAYLRKNVRIVTVPIINMWGFANQKRQNVNGVDLNRNFPYNWERYNPANAQQGETYYKGSEPFSEAEARIIRDLVEEINEGNFVGYSDWHTITTIDAEHILFTPRYLDMDVSMYARIIQGLYKEGNRIVWGTSSVPSIANYVADKYKVSSGNPEWRNGLYGSTRSSIEMTKAVEWFGNIAIGLGMIKTKSNIEALDHFYVKMLKYKNTGENPITISSSNYSNFSHTITRFDIKRHGLLKVSGFVKVRLSEDATISIKPVLYQSYSPDWSWGNIKDNDLFAKTMTLPAGEHIIDLQGMIHALPSNYNDENTNRTELAAFRLRGKTSKGIVTLEETQILIEFIPTDKGTAFEIYDATGRELLSEEDAYERIYPNLDDNSSNEEY